MFLQNFPIFIAASVSNCDLLTESVEFFKIFILSSQSSKKNLAKIDQSRPKVDQIAKMDFLSGSLSTFDTEYYCNATKTLHGVINIRKTCSTKFLKKKWQLGDIFRGFSNIF